MGGIFLGWIILCIVAFILVLILVPSSEYRTLFPFGLASIIILYVIDSTLVKLGAFSYSFGNIHLSGLPPLYLLSGCGGGILLVYFFPSKSIWQFLYILLSSAILLILELIMYWFKYFHYHNWNPFNSYFLNILGFSIVLCFSKFSGYQKN